MLKAHIQKKRRDLNVDVALDLEGGQSLGLFGASGAGKSTVLACIAGIEEPDAGYVELGDLKLFPPSLPLHRRPIGYLTQEPSLFPHLTVQENVTFGMGRRPNGKEGKPGDAIGKPGGNDGITGWKDSKIVEDKWIATLRDRLHLDSVWQASAARVSGGQGRRIALARMLARKPALVLLDEPFAGLDRQLVRELIDDLLMWSATLGFSMIAVDHHAEVLKRLCPRQVIALENGKVAQTGTWEELHYAPATPSLRSLLAPL
jgi:molybdate transport system ATP-binding protein